MEDLQVCGLDSKVPWGSMFYDREDGKQHV